LAANAFIFGRRQAAPAAAGVKVHTL